MLFTLSGCASRKKNTAQTRMYHAFFARYNTFYNGNVAYKKGRDAQIKGHKDNYLEQLPLMITDNENTRQIGKGDFDKAIEKAQKAIKNHSIKRKPRREAGKKLTEKKKRFYAQKEFNPFLWRAWMMMADSYFEKGEFTEAAGTYIYIARLYENNPKVLAAARIGLAQCYTQLEWLYEAEDLISRIKRDSLPSSFDRSLARANANLLIKQGRYKEALPYMEEAVKRKGTEPIERAREYYLMGQLYRETGDNKQAFRCFSKVIAQNPPYELEINARIRQTETVTNEEKKKIVRKIERMIRSPKNQEYLSQLYYALGNVHLSKPDTAKAIQTYETGLAKGEAAGYGAGMLHLSLAEIYWHMQRFSKAAENYQKALGIIEKESEGYDTWQRRTDVAGNLSPHTDIIEKNSELLHWATLDSKSLSECIDKKIEQAEFEEELRKLVEKKERRDSESSDLAAAGTAADMSIPRLDDLPQWYFYNKQTVSKGIKSFSTTWGDRKLKDYWRLSQENIVNPQPDAQTSDSTMLAGGDSIPSDSIAEEPTIEEEETPDTLSTDPTTREYWLQQIPYTDEAKSKMHSELSNALYDAALIFEEQLGDKNLAISHWERLVNEYPEYEKLAEAYYHLYLCTSRWEETDKAGMYKNLLITQFPDSSMTKRIQEPDFFESVETKRHKEDSIYIQTYAEYLAGNHNTVIANNSYTQEKYPQGAHRSRFMFIDALSKLYSERTDDALAALAELINTYPEDEITSIAAEIDSGVRNGRLLRSGISTSIWERRLDGTIKGNTDSIPTFSADRNGPYYFILAFPNDSLDEKRLLFEMARYNFSRYMVRNFNMEFNRLAQITLLEVKEFLSFDETFLYHKRLYGNPEMSRLLQGINTLIISKSNLQLLLDYYTFEDYSKFYEENMLSIPEPEIDGYTLDEPEYIDKETNE